MYLGFRVSRGATRERPWDLLRSLAEKIQKNPFGIAAIVYDGVGPYSKLRS
jgi:hypothetical protein